MPLPARSPGVSSLRFGPLSARTIHLCVDVQNLFYEPTPWHLPWLKGVLPAILRLAEREPARTVFTRFMPPATPEEARGTWRRYYARWAEFTRAHVDTQLLELVPPLARLAPPALAVDKAVYSAFGAPALRAALDRHGTDTVVVSGAETDVCVLASVLGAVDRGLRVVIAVDAICGAADPTHDALMTLYHTRFSQQIETATSAEILDAWPG